MSSCFLAFLRSPRSSHYTHGEYMDKVGNERILTDGRVAMVSHLTFGRARLSVGRADSLIFDDGW